MKVFSIIVLLSFLLYSCGSNKDQTNSSDSTVADTTAIINADTVPTVSTTTQVSNSSDSIFPTLMDFPFEWVMLSKEKGSYVIREYCDAENPSITISPGDDTLYIITNSLGQMSEQYYIREYKMLSPDNYELVCTGKSGERDCSAFINYIDKEAGLVQWKWKAVGEEESGYEPPVYVVKEKVGNYEVIEAGDCDDFF